MVDARRSEIDDSAASFVVQTVGACDVPRNKVYTVCKGRIAARLPRSGNRSAQDGVRILNEQLGEKPARKTANPGNQRAMCHLKVLSALAVLVNGSDCN
jgi:hypothetical protein